MGEVNANSIDIGPESGGRAPLIITEAGLYSLILRSRKPEVELRVPVQWAPMAENQRGTKGVRKAHTIS